MNFSTARRGSSFVGRHYSTVSERGDGLFDDDDNYAYSYRSPSHDKSSMDSHSLGYNASVKEMITSYQRSVRGNQLEWSRSASMTR